MTSNTTNTDVSDDTLTLYFYSDGLTQSERQAVAHAIAADASVAERYKQLADELAAIAMEPAEPVPADLRARFIDTIDRAARLEQTTQAPPGRVAHLPSFFWGAAVTLALAVGLGIGTWFSSNTEGEAGGGPIPDRMVALGTTRTPTFSRSVRVHFSDSRRELARLDPTSDAERILLVADLIAQNRLYEKAAEQNGAPELARVLRAFEPVLVRLAAEELDAAEAEALRAKLGFELDVMLTKLARASSTEASPSVEDTRT